MTAQKKRTISRTEILADIRSGMDRARVKRKYLLSEAALESVFRKLVASGALAEAELPKRVPAHAEHKALPSRPDAGATPWQCPACHSLQAAEVAECPACGVVIAKFLERRSREERTPSAVSGVASGRGRLRVVLVSSIVALAIVAGGLALWIAYGTREKSNVATGVARRHASGKVLNRSPQSGYGDAAGSQRGTLTELQFSSKGFPLGMSASQGSALHLFETPSPNQGFKKMPPETGVKRYYDEFTIAGHTYSVITEETNPPAFYLDANRNGDLTDDPGPFLGERAGVVPNHYTLQLPCRNERKGVPYRIWVFASRMGGVRFYPVCHWQGQIVLNGNTYALVLFDSNADGDYSNDPAVIDADADGRAADKEKLQPGQSCYLDGTSVKLISIAPSGRWVRLEYATGAHRE